MREIKLNLMTGMDALTPDQTSQGWTVIIAFDGHPFLGDEDKKVALRKELTALFDQCLYQKVAAQVSIHTVGAQNENEEIRILLPDINVPQPTALEYKTIFLNVWGIMAAKGYPLTARSIDNEAQFVNQSPVTTPFSFTLSEARMDLVEASPSHPLLELTFTETDLQGFKSVGKGTEAPPLASSPTPPAVPSSSSSQASTSLAKAAALADEPAPMPAPSDKKRRKKEKLGDDASASTASSSADHDAADPDDPQGAPAAASDTQPQKDNTKGDLVQRGIAIYLSRPRTFFSHSHLGFFALLADRDCGKKRAEYYQRELQNSAAGTERYNQLVYALLATKNGVQLKKDVVAAFVEAGYFVRRPDVKDYRKALLEDFCPYPQVPAPPGSPEPYVRPAPEVIDKSYRAIEEIVISANTAR